MSNTPLRMFVIFFNKKESIQRHPICTTDAYYGYILDEIERLKKKGPNGIWVLIVTMNITDGNNHNAILYVVVHYRIIKYLYVNAILFFIFLCVYSLRWRCHVYHF